MKNKRLAFFIVIAFIITIVAALAITIVIMIFLAGKTKENDQTLAGQIVVQPVKEQTGSGQFPFENIQGCCVRVQTDGHHGSGIIYQMTEDEIVIATNRHVLQYWNEDSYVTFFNGAVGNGRAIALSEKTDLGFISVYTSFLTEEEREGLVKADQKKELPGAGTKIYMVDMASDVWNPVIYEGEVLESKRYLEDFGMEMLYGEAASKPGMSGTGVFDAKGCFLGMLTGGTDANEIAAVPAAVLEEEYERLKKELESSYTK